ncbi:hypothetical protein HN51_005099 [Arachis hypogaea]
MVTRHDLFCSFSASANTTIVRSFTTTSHHNNHLQNHKFLDSNTFLESWQPSKDPKEAEAKLAMLRRDYGKVANKERKKLKAKTAQIRAQERKIAQQEFRETLLKERAEKPENWRMKVKKHGEVMVEKKELLHRQSSMWIDEANLKAQILESIVSFH